MTAVSSSASDKGNRSPFLLMLHPGESPMLVNLLNSSPSPRFEATPQRHQTSLTPTRTASASLNHQITTSHLRLMVRRFGSEDDCFRQLSSPIALICGICIAKQTPAKLRPALDSNLIYSRIFQNKRDRDPSAGYEFSIQNETAIQISTGYEASDLYSL